MALQMGKSLLRLRISEAGLNQIEFSKKLGVSPSFVSMVISGSRVFSYPMAINASEILGCEPKYLHEWKEVPLSQFRRKE
jgi:transcriptional regulator with XRE-family HTH domain